jgi:hypothetical protein
MDEVKLACVTEMMISSKNPASDVITVDLPSKSLLVCFIIPNFIQNNNRIFILRVFFGYHESFGELSS